MKRLIEHRYNSAQTENIVFIGANPRQTGLLRVLLQHLPPDSKKQKEKEDMVIVETSFYSSNKHKTSKNHRNK